MVFVGAAILPHGTMIFDGDPKSSSSACRERNGKMPSDIIAECHELFTGCDRAGDLVAGTNCEVVLLMTPHGITLSSGSYGVYMSCAAKGNALWNGCFQDIEVSVDLDTELSEQLLKFVQEEGIEADGIITFSRVEAPLRWGEVVPLWFVKDKLKGKSDNVKYVIVTVGKKSEKFEEMGKALYSFTSRLQQRVAVVISGDLAHTHKTDCSVPLYLPDPRWGLGKSTDIAEEFDRNWEMWCRSVPTCKDCSVESGCSNEVSPWIPNQSLPWLEKAVQDDPVALSCGRRGFQILHSFLEKAIDEGSSVTSHFLTRHAPTYYGMMAVFFDVHM